MGAVVLVVAVAAGIAADSGASSRVSAQHRSAAATTTILVWPDATRVPAFKAYAKTHPNVHLQIVTRDAGTNGAATLQAKINLFNRTGHGWPDIVFVDPNDISWLSAAPYDYAAPLDGMIPKKTIQGYPGSVLSGVCEIGGKLYCLRNDLAQDVLWYNAKLMRKFGYQVPKTWEQYRQLGLKVAREHPGYVVGALGTTPPQTYFEASRCPMHTIVGENKLLIDPSSPRCTRMINLLDSLRKAGSVTPLSELGSDFVKKYGATDKILMLYGASWYGEYLFHQAYHSPVGEIAAAAPPRWAGEPKAYTGQVGGGIYVISKHAADPKAAADVINWVSTNPQYQLTAPTYPAYGPVAAKWLAKQSNEKYFASSVAPAFKTAAEQIWGDYGFVKINDLGIWSSAVVPKITQGGSLASAWKSFGDQLEQQAKINGYQVVSK